MEDAFRNYLRYVNGDIFDVIMSAIMVAASDHPQEFQNKREMIAQTLFNCKLINCSGCRNCKNQNNINASGENEDHEATIVANVLKMKDILERSGDASESILLDALSKLQYIVKSVTILKLTGVGTSVSALHNHASKNVAKISRTLVNEWRCMVDEWIKDTKNMHEQKQTTPTSDQQQPRMIVRIKLNKDALGSVKETSVPKGPVTLEQKVETVNDEVLRIKGILEKNGDDESVVCELLKKLGSIRVTVETLEATGIGKKVRVLEKHGSKDVREIAWMLVKKWKGMVEEHIKKEASVAATNNNSEKVKNGVEEKFKAAKRKLQEAYEETERKKKNRRIQVVELHELTNKGFSMHPQKKPLIKRQIKRVV